MSSAETGTTPAADACGQAIEALCAAAERALETGDLAALSPRTIQQLMRAAVKLYVAKREAGEAFNPVGDDDLNATEVSATATGLLNAVRLEPFELSWWRRFGQL